MSNHSGSYMLNDTLRAFFDLKIDEKVGHDTTIEFAKRLLKISDYHDCNIGEILDGLNHKLPLCYYCTEESDSLNDEYLCPKCKAELGR